MDSRSLEKPKSKPGFIEFKQVSGKNKLDDLWFFVGSRCNLSCRHCYVSSSPNNDSVQQLSLEDIKPFLEEAKDFGVENIYFTGGEPFINKGIMQMIEESLKYGNVTVLTNATYPIINHISKLKELNDSSDNEIRLRVSLDHYDQEKHDEIRGKGNFDIAIKNIISLEKNGFKPIITVSSVVFEDNDLTQKEIEEKFKELFSSYGVNFEVKFLPNLEMGSNLNRIDNVSKKVFISENCMKLPSVKNENFQCYNGRTIEKINGKTFVYPCPVIYNDSEFELSDNLKDSFKKVFLTHKACFDFCYKSKGKCTN